MWRTLSACILFVFLSLPVVEAATEQMPDARTQAPEERIIVPPFDLHEEDVRGMKEKMARLKPLIEKDRELSRMRVRDVDETPGIVPRIRLAYGYGSVINLPYGFNLDDVAVGAREKFDIGMKGTSLVIFPVKEFKSTNIVVFEKTPEGMVPHHYMLVEDGASSEADLTVNIRRGGLETLADATQAMVRVITTQRIPEKGSADDTFLEGRSAALTGLSDYPFIRMMKLSGPELHVFLVAGKVMPVGDAEFTVDLGNGTTVLASRAREITVRRVADGKTFTNAR